MAEAFTVIVATVRAGPSLRLGRPHVDGRRRPAARPPSDARRQTLGDPVRRSARRLPSKPAIVCGRTRRTFAGFERIVERLAGGLVSARPARPAGLVVGKGDRVAVPARDPHAFVALRFALARPEAVRVPVSCRPEAEEVADALRRAGAQPLPTP